MLKHVVDSEVALALPRPNLDSAPLYALIEKNRSYIGEFLDWAENMKDAKEEATFLKTVNENFGAGKSLNLVIFYREEICGMISLNQFHRLSQSADIGYWLAEEFSGRGIMHRAVAGICELGFTDYVLNKITIAALVHNTRSNAVAKKAGFHCDGTFRAGQYIHGKFYDMNEWSLLKSDWQKEQH